jgi:hypothetical protein
VFWHLVIIGFLLILIAQVADLRNIFTDFLKALDHVGDEIKKENDKDEQ